MGSDEQVRLSRIWCSVEDCIGYAQWQVDFDGPLLCRKHARLVRMASRSKYLTRLIGHRGTAEVSR